MSNTTIYLVFGFPYFNGDIFWYFRPSSDHLRETELNLHAVQLCSMGFHNIRRAQMKVGLINLCKGLFSLNARIYYKLKSGT